MNILLFICVHNIAVFRISIFNASVLTNCLRVVEVVEVEVEVVVVVVVVVVVER